MLNKAFRLTGTVRRASRLREGRASPTPSSTLGVKCTVFFIEITK